MVAAAALSLWGTSARAYIQVGSALSSSGGWLVGSSLRQSVSAIGQGHPIGATISIAHTNHAGLLFPYESQVDTNNYPPILAPIGSKVVLVGQMLNFTAFASDPNGTLPALSAFPLPAGAAFEISQSGTNRLGAFSWTPGVAQIGAHPIRFSAYDGEYTSKEVVVVYVGASGDGTNNVDGLPDSLVNYNPLTNLIASSSGNATLQWHSVSGIAYKIYYSDQAVSSNMTWHFLTEVSATGALGRVVDGSFGGSPGRTYTLVFEDGVPSARGAWRGNKKPLSGQRFSLAGPAVESDRSFGGVMGSNLASTLTGDASGLEDRIHVLQPNGMWRILWLDDAGRWREASDNSYSTYVLPPGRGFVVERPSLSAASLTLAGRVGNQFTNSVTLLAGWNLLSLSEGKALSLNEVFGSGDPIGGTSVSNADQIHLMNDNGSWTTLIYVQGWGAPWDGNWLNLNTFQIYTNRLMPGQAYYYYRQSGSTTVEF